MKNLAAKSLFTITAVLIITFSITSISPVNAASETTIQQLKLNSIGSQDGWILESSETSGVGTVLDNQGTYLYLGDDRYKRQYRSILSFKTSVLPDNATITSAILRIRQYSILGGGNPAIILSGFIVDIVNGHFGTYAALQYPDFQIAANGTYGPINTTLSAYKTYRFNLKTLKSFINKTTTASGLTQIRLSFAIDDNGDDFANTMLIYSGNAPMPADRPQMVINYTVP